MALIEGIGDEVLIFVALVFMMAVILIAWTSTSVRPMFNNGSVWMVHMQTAPERRVLEVYSLDDGAAASSVPAAASNRQPSSSTTTTETRAIPIVDESATPTTTIVESVSENSSLTNSSTSGGGTDESDDNATATTTATERSQIAVDRDRTTANLGDDNDGSTEPRRRILTSAAAAAANDGSNANVVTTTTTTTTTTDEQQQSQSTTSDTTTIKLKFLDDTQKLVATWLSQTVGEFKRQHFETDVSQGKVVRLIYRGQLLRDDSRSLASYGLHDNCVLHCHVSTTPYEQQSQSSSNARGGATNRFDGGQNGHSIGGANNGLDLGRYIYVILAFNFAAIWSAWFVFPEYFSRTSLVSLILCTGLFLLFWYGSQRRRPHIATRTVATANVGGN